MSGLQRQEKKRRRRARCWAARTISGFQALPPLGERQCGDARLGEGFRTPDGIRKPSPQVPRSSGYGYDDGTAAGTQLSRILWIQGFADQAIAVARGVIADAVSQDHIPSVCFALAMAACPIAFWVGDRRASRRYVDVLPQHSNKNSLAFWRD
jgi:hypothetical protein